MAGTPLSAPREARARWYLQVDKYGKTVKDICNIFGISRKTYYKWYNLDHNLVVRDSKRRGIHPHTKLTSQVKMIIYDNKIKYNYGPKKMRVYLKNNHNITISANTIYKYYQRKHLIRKPQMKQIWYLPLKQPYYATIPGENVQLDVKYVPGKDMTWNYQYRLIDTVTNIQFAVNEEYKDSQTTITVFKKAIKYFPFKITGIQTDNGSEFRKYFHKYLIKNNIVHRYIPKRSAPWNGKVERANRSIDDEFYLNATRPWNSLNMYVHWYNYERPHLGKQMYGLTPIQKYLSLAKSKV
jgi:IS30 family transposase